MTSPIAPDVAGVDLPEIREPRRLLRTAGAFAGLAGASAALAQLRSVIDADAAWGNAWRERLVVLEAAGAASLESGGPVLVEDVRDVDHRMAPGGRRSGLIRGFLSLWRAESAAMTRRVDRAAVFRALGRIAGVSGDRLVAELDARDKALLGIDPMQTSKAVDRFCESLPEHSGPFPGPVASATAMALWSALDCGGPGSGCWIGAVVLARRQGWTRTVPLIAGGFSTAGLGHRPAPDDYEWVGTACEAIRRGAELALDTWFRMEARAGVLASILSGRGGRYAEAVSALALRRDSFTPADLASRAGSRSDRSARRIVAELVEAGALRELTGRAAFRIYGL